MTTTDIPCDRCGRRASRVTLVPPGGRDPQAAEPGTEATLPGRWRLSVDGPVHVTHHLVGALATDPARLAAIVDAGDARALHALNPEFAPSLCPDCDRNYCEWCWRIVIVDDGGFYDCTRGTCPEGHQRILDD